MSNKKSFAVGISFYNPSDNAVEYVHKISFLFDYIYIFDNSEDVIMDDKIFDSNVRYISYNKNLGLSKAFNIILENAKEDCVDYLLLLDQDSCFETSKLEQLMDRVLTEKTTDIVIYTGYLCVKDYPAKINIPNERVSFVGKTISSGSIINMTWVNKKDMKYNEKIFLDNVDFDFCRLATKEKLKICRYNDIVLEQTLGYMHEGVICHSALRHYYAMRDYGYMNQRYDAYGIVVLKNIRFFVREVRSCIKEDDSLVKIRYCIRGLIDWTKNITGERVEDR